MIYADDNRHTMEVLHRPLKRKVPDENAPRTIEYVRVSDDPDVQARYEASRAAGASHSIAEICAFRQAPGTKGTDRAFLEGRHDTQFQDDPEYEKFCRAKAHAAGVPTAGKIYDPQMADEVGDPKAWFSDASEIKRALQAEGGSCTGAITVKRPSYRAPTAKRPKLAPELVEHYINEDVKKNPALKRKPKQELREKVLAERGPRN
jgi:hypothetical protein